MSPGALRLFSKIRHCHLQEINSSCATLLPTVKKPGLPSLPLTDPPHRKRGDRQLVDILHAGQAESTKQGGGSYIGKEKNNPCMKTPRPAAGIR